jgi:ech hydrogenase subunit F
MGILGMSRIVLKNLFLRPATRRYPQTVRPPFAVTRGEIKIDIDACIFCGLCSRRCPAQALAVSKPEKSWEIDPLRCVMCRLCIDVCPKRCLRDERRAHVPVLVRGKHKHVQAPKPGAPIVDQPTTPSGPPQ